MLKIGFVQVNYSVGPKSSNTYFLPYSVGVLISCLTKMGIEFEVTDILFKRDLIDDAVQKLSRSDVIAFSSYVWNKEYNYVLAKKLKTLNPKIIIIFGGPEVPHSDIEIFKKHPYIDLVVELEGEIAFVEILKNLSTPENFKNIPGLLINKNKIPLRGKSPIRVEQVDDIPSPYLTGVFDKLLTEFPQLKWAMTLETNRGCPYQCTFCDWGSLTYSKIKKFNLERVLEEITWAGKNKIYNIFLADANFGIFPERDNIILDALIRNNEVYAFPKNISINWAKNQKSTVVEMAKKLINSGYNNGLTVSFQTLNDNVLENIKRKNLGINQVEETFKICRESNVPVNTELILGLPGETLKSWKSNFYKLFRLYHKVFTVLQCEILENSEMNQVQRNQYNIKTVTSIDNFPNAGNEEISEYLLIVTETKDLPFLDMIEAHLWNWLFYTFHILGLTNYISEFLERQQVVTYENFYEGLFEYLQKDAILKQEINLKRQQIKTWLSTGASQQEIINNITFEGTRLILYSTISKLYLDFTMKKHVQLLIRNYVQQHTNAVLEDLLDFQEVNLIDFYKMAKYPITRSFKYDWIDYFLNKNNLKDKTTDIVFDNKMTDELIGLDPENLVDYIYFRRKTLFGQASISYKEKDEPQRS